MIDKETLKRNFADEMRAAKRIAWLAGRAQLAADQGDIGALISAAKRIHVLARAVDSGVRSFTESMLAELARNLSPVDLVLKVANIAPGTKQYEEREFEMAVEELVALDEEEWVFELQHGGCKGCSNPNCRSEELLRVVEEKRAARDWHAH